MVSHCDKGVKISEVRLAEQLQDLKKPPRYAKSKRAQDFFSLPPRKLQSDRRHSAILLTVTINGMQEKHPVIYLLLKFNHN